MSNQDMINAILSAVADEATLLQLIRLSVSRALNQMSSDQLLMIMSALNIPQQ